MITLYAEQKKKDTDLQNTHTILKVIFHLQLLQYIGYIPHIVGASLVSQTVKNLPAVQEMEVQALGWRHPLEKGVATHSSVLFLENPMDRGAWRATVHGVALSDMTE